MQNFKKYIPWLIIGLLVIWVIVKYNGIVSYDQKTKSAWADVESDYQRRMDLIPNLVNTVKGYADFEQETLTKVIEARSKATGVTIDPSNITPDQLAQFQQAQDNVSSALSRLLVVVEKYPDLKANEGFLNLQSQLEGTENRISVSRKRFNEAVQAYNAAILGFPSNIIANIFGFQEKAYFKSAEGADKAPEVKF
jgi:LemA protein